jgi:hypothetical protein
MEVGWLCVVWNTILVEPEEDGIFAKYFLFSLCCTLYLSQIFMTHSLSTDTDRGRFL